MRPIIPQTPRSCSGEGWISWNPTYWAHSTSLQFSGFPAYLLLCWHSLRGGCCTRAIASARLGVEHRPSEWSTHCVGLCRGCLGLRGGKGAAPGRPSGAALTLPCWRQAVLTWVKVQQHQWPLTSILGSYGETRCQAMELQHQLQPRLGTLSGIGLSNISTIGHPEACREGGFPKQDPQNKCAEQGPLKGGQQETCETGLGPRSWNQVQDAHKGRDEPALRVRCPYLLPLPLEVRCWNLSSRPRQEKVPCLSERKGCLSSPFPTKRKPLSEGIESPIPTRAPCRPGYRLSQWRESQCSQTPVLHGEIKHPLV